MGTPTNIEVLEYEGFKNVAHDMSDRQADYYTAELMREPYVIKWTHEGDLFCRRVNMEDWHYMFEVEKEA
jgi:hypothetical protein